MAASHVKRDIRAKMLRWKLSVAARDKKDEKFVGDVFKELDTLMEVVFEKHDGSLTYKECHAIVDTWPMTRRCLVKLHESIFRRLRNTPSTASPYYCSFTREVPREVFNIIWKQIVHKNSFGHTVNSTPARVTIIITDIRKAVYLFHRMNKDGVIVEKAKLLKKCYPDNGIAKVLVSQEKPMTLKYSMNTELLAVNFHYGYWNSFGVPQH